MLQMAAKAASVGRKNVCLDVW